MISNAPNHLLYIEPTAKAAEEPVVDQLTRQMTAAFRTAKDSASQTEAAGGSQWVVFRVTDITTPAVDIASEDVKKLKDTLQRALSQEQSAEYVARLEKDIGTTINEAAVAQVVGSNQ